MNATKRLSSANESTIYFRTSSSGRISIGIRTTRIGFIRSQCNTPIKEGGLSMTSPFTSPSSSSGESVKPADLQGHLLIIKPVEYKTGIQTSLGEAEAIEVDIVDLDTQTEHTSVLFFNVALRAALKSNIGKSVLAKIGQGVAKPGKSAPWILIDETGNADSVAKATAYLAGGISAPAQAAPVAETKTVDGVELTPEIQMLMAKLGAKPF